MTERRYSDDDVQRILANAAEAEVARGTGTAAEGGLTLTEIQRIAVEAGLNPASIAAAAEALDRSPHPLPESRVLGLRSGVAVSLELAHDLDDAQWRRLVAYLRDTFEAQGRLEETSGRREWRNGNLRISLESVGSGALLQMRTRKESASSMIRSGLTMAAVAAGLAGFAALTGRDPQAIAAVLAFAAGGGVMAIAGALQLPSWSSTRRKQFEAVADYARRLS